MPSLAGLAVMLLWCQPALAHGGDHDVAPSWTFDSWIVTPLLLLGFAYGLGTLKLWPRTRAGHKVHARKTTTYALGWLFLAVALVSPIHALGEQIFTVHMIEHEIIMVIAAPLLVLARPAAAFLWALPKPARFALATATRRPLMRGIWTFLTTPRNATMIHGLAIWIWHMPILFDSTVSDVLVHRLQHVSFLLTALLFWWALIWRAGYGVAAWHIFVTMVHTSILGALMAVAPRVIYTAQTAHALDLGLTPLEDQQLAGIVMWVPAGTIYAAATLVFVALWISRSAPGGHTHALPR
jgi:putative membrane protein